MTSLSLLCLFVVAAAEGGAMKVESFSHIHLTGDMFWNNSAVYSGGAMNVQNSVVILSTCDFSASLAENGGAIYATSGADLLLSRCSLRYNRATYNGGSVFVQSGNDMAVFDSDISMNWASTGAGLYITDTEAEVRNTSFNDNRAIERGGAMCLSSKANVSVAMCSFLNNWAFQGGGASIDASLLMATSSTFQGTYVYMSPYATIADTLLSISEYFSFLILVAHVGTFSCRQSGKE